MYVWVFKQFGPFHSSAMDNIYHIISYIFHLDHCGPARQHVWDYNHGQWDLKDQCLWGCKWLSFIDCIGCNSWWQWYICIRFGANVLGLILCTMQKIGDLVAV